MKHLFITLVVVLIGHSYASAACVPCASANTLIKKIEEKNIKPEVLDTATVNEQYTFINEGSDIISKILVQLPFLQEHAEAVIRLTLKVKPYDAPLTVAEENVAKFRKVYKANKTTFTKTFDDLIKTKVITATDKKEFLEFMGAYDL